MIARTNNLPLVKGRYQLQALLSQQTWFQVGGAAEVLFKPQSEADLIIFLQQKSDDIPITLIGAGSNILVRDGGIKGIVIRLGRGFTEMNIEGTTIVVGSGALDRTVALTCADAGLSGLEFLIGIPGTIGGAVKMNAGCYSVEVKDVLLWVEVLDNNGVKKRLFKEELGFTYRHSNLSAEQIILRACFALQAEDPSVIHQRLQQLLTEREKTQPVRGRTGGSTFKNPSHHKAWELIDHAGCRGMQLGQAQVSEKHCNFLLNLGQATANELESLGEQVRNRVFDKCGINLEWEIIRLGN